MNGRPAEVPPWLAGLMERAMKLRLARDRGADVSAEWSALVRDLYARGLRIVDDGPNSSRIERARMEN